MSGRPGKAVALGSVVLSYYGLIQDTDTDRVAKDNIVLVNWIVV